PPRSTLFPYTTLFRSEDVGRRHRGKQQMARGHYRRRPEGNDEAEVDRMAHELVEHRCLEPHLAHFAPHEVVHDLMQPEQLEVIRSEEHTSELQSPCNL